MPGESFTRPRDQFRFKFSGMKLNTPADNLPPDKYALAINIRSVDDTSIRTRPGQTLQFPTVGTPITDMRTYAALMTGDAIRTLVRNAIDNIYLDDSALVGTLASAIPPAPGASMIPFRPSQSPNPYMYIANGTDYQKFSAPDASNNVIASQVGIPEPQVPPEAVALPPIANVKVIPLGAWTLGGTATTLTATDRVNDFAEAVAIDPNNNQYSVAVSPTASYQRGMVLSIGAAGQEFWVEDIFPALPFPLTIQSIFYFDTIGQTGRCVLVLQNLSSGSGTSDSIYSPDVLAGLHRGAMLQFSSGGEIGYILSTTAGPDSSLAIETSTTINHAPGELVEFRAAIQVEQLAGTVPPVLNAPIHDIGINYLLPSGGIGSATAAVTNLFTVNNTPFQQTDYISFGVYVENPTTLIEAKILFDVSDGNFDLDYFYYTIRPSDLANAIADTATQLEALQTYVQRTEIAALGGPTSTFASAQTATGDKAWTQILIPINELTRVGSNLNLTLENLVAVQFQWNASTLAAVANDYTIAVWGGSKPDVGDVGIPYLYRLRFRDSTTGAISNPSPATRYGVSPRRQSVNVSVPGVSFGVRYDTTDIFRYGGSVTKWRFIGSIQLNIHNTVFVDNFDDAAAQAGDVLDFDNFEPWPSIDFPLNTFTVSVAGTTALVTIPTPNNVLRFLPGTLALLGGQSAYTIWTRPTLVAGTPNTYLFQFVENAGSQTLAQPELSLTIYEPAIARQFLPYMWGPDDAGTVFAVGDPLRPGTLYFAKNYNPDSAPDAYNIELVQPSEPLQGGEILDGRSFVASSERWWALYPQPDNPAQRYNAVLQPIPRGLAAPFAHCNDGVSIYWWAKDGIWSSSKGSLTDADLYNIFPHEGVPGTAVTYGTPPVGRTIFPPDYTKAGGFRLAYCNYYLYATYQDASGAYNTLVYDVRRDAWSLDQHPDPVTVFYQPEQLANQLLMGDSDGDVLMETANANDAGTPISCILATMEFDAGDIRAPKQWGDLFLDSTPASATGMSLNPTSFGAPIIAAIPVPQSGVRIRQPISLGGIVVADTFGLIILWTDDFTSQTVTSRLFVWQPSLSIQPANTIAWQTFGASFGMQGYGHIPQISVAWVSQAPITLTIQSVDGQSPTPIIIPSSGGKYNKQLFRVSANKGQLYNFKAVSSQPFQFFLDDFEIAIGAWSRSTPYTFEKRFGGEGVSSAPI